MAFKAERWSPDGGGVRVFDFDLRNKIPDPDNAGQFKVPFLNIKAGSLLTVFGVIVLETSDDSQANSLSIGAPSGSTTSFHMDTKSDSQFYTYTNSYHTNTSVSIYGLFGDGTTGKGRLFYQVING